MVREAFAQSRIIIAIALLLTFLQPAYGNGGHVHLGLGGVFFLLLGGVVFIGGFIVVLYFLLRSNPDAAGEEHDDDE